MSWQRTLAFMILVFLLQTVIMPYFRVFGVQPDLFLVTVVLTAFMFGSRYGVMIGAIAGLLQDIFSSTVYVHTLSKMIVGFMIGLIKENVLGEEEAVSAVMVFFISMIAAIIDASLLYFFLGRPVASLNYIFITGIVYSFYNVIFVPLIYPVIRMLEVKE